MTVHIPPYWAGAVPFLTIVQHDAPGEPWGDEFLRWYEPDRWAGEHRACAVFLLEKFTKLQAEIERLADVLPLHEVGSAYAHRLAVMLECALLDRTGTWDDGHALLEEYRAACRAAGPDQEPPTFMGEPVVLPNVELTGRLRSG